MIQSLFLKKICRGYLAGGRSNRTGAYLTVNILMKLGAKLQNYEIKNIYHWRIEGGAKGALAPPP